MGWACRQDGCCCCGHACAAPAAAVTAAGGSQVARCRRAHHGVATPARRLLQPRQSMWCVSCSLADPPRCRGAPVVGSQGVPFQRYRHTVAYISCVYTCCTYTLVTASRSLIPGLRQFIQSGGTTRPFLHGTSVLCLLFAHPKAVGARLLYHMFKIQHAEHMFPLGKVLCAAVQARHPRAPMHVGPYSLPAAPLGWGSLAQWFAGRRSAAIHPNPLSSLAYRWCGCLVMDGHILAAASWQTKNQGLRNCTVIKCPPYISARGPAAWCVQGAGSAQCQQGRCLAWAPRGSGGRLQMQFSQSLTLTEQVAACVDGCNAPPASPIQVGRAHTSFASGKLSPMHNSVRGRWRGQIATSPQQPTVACRAQPQ
jgi:hypothetical protein